MGCKAKSCIHWKKCWAKSECGDDRCWDYKKDPQWKPKPKKQEAKKQEE